jgi:hypothetical protein
VLGLYNNDCFVVWPSCYFDEEYRIDTLRVDGNGKFRVIKVDTTSHHLDEDMDEKSHREGSWWVATREGSYVGLLCSHSTMELKGRPDDGRAPSLHLRQLPPAYLSPPSLSPPESAARPGNIVEVENDDVQQVFPQQRVCSASNHTWVICVGDCSEYPDVASFIDHCTGDIVLQQRQEGELYKVSVTDASSCRGEDGKNADDESSSALSIQLEVHK